MRVSDETIVSSHEQESVLNFDHDEFSRYFKGSDPKIIITTSIKPSKDTLIFANELANVFYNATYVNRQMHEMKQILNESINGSYTDIVVISERQHKPYSMTVIHLPSGPTAYFRLTSVKVSKSIKVFYDDIYPILAIYCLELWNFH